MSLMSPPPPFRVPPLYPESDGKPLADNTKQAQWIIMLFDNLTALFAARPDVFVAADLLWYPREGDSSVSTAPDVMVAFGRPKGHRPSYKQWEEGDIPVTVAFEILSPTNDIHEMADKLAFYDDYGVEEYYVHDPEKNRLEIYRRRGEAFRRVSPVQDFLSPRLGIRFDLSGPEMAVFGSGGQRFITFQETQVLRTLAEQLVEQERKQRLKLERRLARVLELSRKLRLQQISPEELQELERLENEPPIP